MWHMLCGVMSDYIRDDSKDPPIDVLRDLPEGLLWTIFLKLPRDVAVRTSALSRQWSYFWTDCPKLILDGDTLCGQIPSFIPIPFTDGIPPPSTNSSPATALHFVAQSPAPPRRRQPPGQLLL